MKWVYSSRSLFLDGTAHQGSITCIDGHRDNVLIATGSEDSTVKIVNTNSGKVRISHVFFTIFTMIVEGFWAKVPLNSN